MSIRDQFEAGFVSKSDCLVKYQATAEPLSIEVHSSVQSLFGNAIRTCAMQMLEEFKVTTGALLVDDDGALDLVIRARIEAVLRSAGYLSQKRLFVDASSEISRQTGVPTIESEKNASLDGGIERPGRSLVKQQVRLYMPGDQPHFAINADFYGADILIFDLEDSVPLARKFEARILVRRFLENSFLFRKSERAVRINPLSTEESVHDIVEIVPAMPDIILLPKCESAMDVERLDTLLTANEEEYGLVPGSIRIMPIIESAKGVLAAYEIARASQRNSALCFGYEDFSRDIQSKPDIVKVAHVQDDGSQKVNIQLNPVSSIDSLLARQIIILASRAADIEPLDSSYSDIENTKGLLNSCYEARALGFTGKSVIHPSQIPYVKKAFLPSDEEVQYAKAVIAAYEESLKAGKGAVAIDGQMIDIPVVEKARRIIEESMHAE
ncbi:MAG TPA: aldolase/citrate lyase family protein [Rectinema sp.]|nr:aldolase/citrate lyase family protein [Rectinema sp.]